MTQRKLTYTIPFWCYQANTTEQTRRPLAALREIGATGVEIPPDDQIAPIKSAGLSVSSLMAPSLTRGLNRREHHAELVPIIEERIATAKKHGIPFVLVFSGNREGQADAEGIANCSAALKKLAPIAQRNGVTLLIEMLNTTDHPDYQAAHGRYGFDVCRAVDSPAMKTVYDIYHMHRMGDDVLKDVLDNLRYVGHIHIAASPKRDMPRAGGEIDYARLIPAIQQAGYTGAWGLEFLGADPIAEFTQTMDWFDSWAG